MNSEQQYREASELRRIDELVAEHIFEIREKHYERIRRIYERNLLAADLFKHGMITYKEMARFFVGDVLELPHFSSDIVAAWQVVKELDGEWKIFEQENVGWLASFYSSPGGMDAKIIRVEARADTAPLAICLAALEAKGISSPLAQTPSADDDRTS